MVYQSKHSGSRNIFWLPSGVKSGCRKIPWEPLRFHRERTEFQTILWFYRRKHSGSQNIFWLHSGVKSGYRKIPWEPLRFHVLWVTLLLNIIPKPLLANPPTHNFGPYYGLSPPTHNFGPYYGLSEKTQQFPEYFLVSCRC